MWRSSGPVKAGAVIRLSFLGVELILYYLILTTGGEVLRWSSWISIVVCFLYTLGPWSKRNALVVAGLGCTVVADLFLVVCDPIQRLWGMIAFLCAQTLYAVHLHRLRSGKWMLIFRVGLLALGTGICVAVLGAQTDLLALVSIAYYACLIMNLIHGVRSRKGWLLPVALVLFLLCDTVIGLQVASMGYLPIGEGSWLYRVIFPGWNMAWAFYLPSQVMLAVYASR